MMDHRQSCVKSNRLGGHTTCVSLSAATRKLLALEVRPGSWRLEFWASWLNETESGTMSCAAAQFWSDWEHMLQPGYDMEEVREELLAEWNEEEAGPLPGVDSPEMDFCLEGDENQAVRQGVEIALPWAMFATAGAAAEATRSGGATATGGSMETAYAPEPERSSDEQPESEGGRGDGGGSSSSSCSDTVTIKLEQVASWAVEVATAAEIGGAWQRLAWATATVADVLAASAVDLLSIDLIERVGVAHTLHCATTAEGEQRLCVIPDCDSRDHFFPPPVPGTWEYCMGWKGSSGTAELEVTATNSSQQQTAAPRTLALGEVLLRQLSGSIGFIDGECFCKDIELDGQYIEWEEWNSKTADMVVTRPLLE